MDCELYLNKHVYIYTCVCIYIKNHSWSEHLEMTSSNFLMHFLLDFSLAYYLCSKSLNEVLLFFFNIIWQLCNYKLFVNTKFNRCLIADRLQDNSERRGRRVWRNMADQRTGDSFLVCYPVSWFSHLARFLPVKKRVVLRLEGGSYSCWQVTNRNYSYIGHSQSFKCITYTNVIVLICWNTLLK